MISLSKIIDPLSGYIDKVKSDAEDRNSDRRSSYPSVYKKYIQGPATISSGEDSTKAAYANRLTAEINEIISGLSNARDGLSVLDEASKGYDSAISILNDMQSLVSVVQNSESSVNFQLSTDADDLAASLTAYNTKLQAVIDDTEFNSQKLLDGNFTNKSFPLWQGESNPAKISLNSLGADMNAFRSYSAFAITGGIGISSNSIVASKSITISGEDGTQSVTQVVGESAATVASRINYTELNPGTKIGVTALPRTAVRLNDLTRAGTVSMSITSASTSSSGVGTGDVVISDATNLTALMSAINNISESTDVVASMDSNNNSDILIKSYSGSNIGFKSFAHSVSGEKITASVDRREGTNDFPLADTTNGTYASDTGYAGGSITFTKPSNLVAKNTLLASETISTSVGTISTNNGKVYIGTGSGSSQIGSVDSSSNGVGNNDLTVNFSANSRTFTNGTFSSDSNWLKNSSQIVSGTTQLSGETTLLDETFESGNEQGASGTLTVTAGDDGDTISAVTINSVNLLTSSVSFTTDNDTTAALIRAEINNGTSSGLRHGYTATVSNAVVTITAADNTGTGPNSYSITQSSNGDFAANVTGLSGGVDNDKASITGGTPFATNISGGVANMVTTNATTANPFTHVKGPAIMSNASVTIADGEKVSFDWTASGQNSDYYDIQAFLVDTDDNDVVELLNRSGSSGSGSVTSSALSAGNYKFVFVSGAFDNDGDRDSSSSVTLDNVVVSAISDDVLESVRDNVTYEDLSFSATDAIPNPFVRVTSVKSDGGSSNTQDLTLPANQVGFAMKDGSNHTVIATGEVAVLSGSNFTITQEDAEENGTTFFSQDNPTVSELAVTGLSASSSLIEQNASERIQIAINNLLSAQIKGLNSMRSQFDLGGLDTSNYLESLKFNEKLVLEPVTTQNLTQITSKMIIASEVEALLAKAGNASADDVYDLLKM
jgi:flagellin